MALLKPSKKKGNQGDAPLGMALHRGKEGVTPQIVDKRKRITGKYDFNRAGIFLKEIRLVPTLNFDYPGKPPDTGDDLLVGGIGEIEPHRIITPSIDIEGDTRQYRDLFF